MTADINTEDLPLPRIRCLWCDHRDENEFDLSLHMLEKHKEKLLEIPILSRYRKRTKVLSGDFFARFEGSMEFRLDVALGMAKQENRRKGVRHAVRILQKRAIERRIARQAQVSVAEVEIPPAQAEARARWKKEKNEWIQKWPVEVDPASRYISCNRCKELIVKNKDGICDDCYWLDIWWNQGGVKAPARPTYPDADPAPAPQSENQLTKGGVS